MMDTITLFDTVAAMAAICSSCSQTVDQVLRIFFFANLVFPVVYMSVHVAIAYVKYIFVKVCPWPVTLFDL